MTIDIITVIRVLMLFSPKDYQQVGCSIKPIMCAQVMIITGAVLYWFAVLLLLFRKL